MSILFSSTETIDCCNGQFYNNAVRIALPRYHRLGKHIVCLAFRRDVEQPKQEPIDDPDVEFVFLKKVNTLKSLFIDRRKNAQIIEQEVRKADACVAHVPSFIGDTVARTAKRLGKPCLTVVVGCAWDAYWNYNCIGKLIAPFRYASLRSVQREASYSIYVTQKFLQKRYPSRGLSIGCSDVDIKINDEQVLQQRMRHIAGRNGILRMATIAAVDVRYKGQEYVIRALSLLKQQGILLEYHLVGGGDKSFLQRLAKHCDVSEQVIFHGLMPHDQILPFLDEMDIYIQPSKQEGLPRALIEAMSRGCFSLGAKTAGIPELLSSKYIFRRGNVGDIVKALSHITRQELQEQALQNFKEAQKYDSSLLNKQRNEFLELFKCRENISLT